MIRTIKSKAEKSINQFTKKEVFCIVEKVSSSYDDSCFSYNRCFFTAVATVARIGDKLYPSGRLNIWKETGWIEVTDHESLFPNPVKTKNLKIKNPKSDVICPCLSQAVNNLICDTTVEAIADKIIDDLKEYASELIKSGF